MGVLKAKMRRCGGVEVSPMVVTCGNFLVELELNAAGMSKAEEQWFLRQLAATRAQDIRANVASQ